MILDLIHSYLHSMTSTKSLNNKLPLIFNLKVVVMLLEFIKKIYFIASGKSVQILNDHTNKSLWNTWKRLINYKIICYKIVISTTAHENQLFKISEITIEN